MAHHFGSSCQSGGGNDRAGNRIRVLRAGLRLVYVLATLACYKVSHMSKIIDVKSKEQFEAALKEAKGRVVIGFSSEGCPACAADASKLKKIASCENTTVLRIDADMASDVADDWKVQETPSVFVAENADAAKPGKAKEYAWAEDVLKALKCERVK